MKYIQLARGFHAAKGRRRLRSRSSLWELHRFAMAPAEAEAEPPIWSRIALGLFTMLIVLALLLLGAAWLTALR